MTKPWTAVALLVFASSSGISCKAREEAPPAVQEPLAAPAPTVAEIATEPSAPEPAPAVAPPPPTAAVATAPPPGDPVPAPTRPKPVSGSTQSPPASGPPHPPAGAPTSLPAPTAIPPTAAPAPVPAPPRPSVSDVADPGGEILVPAAKAGLTRVGADKCKLCHKVQHASWAASAHARRTPPLDCEGCHGPGSEYKALAVMKDPAKARAAGLVDPDAAFCGRCHRGKWDPSLLGKAHAHKAAP